LGALTTSCEELRIQILTAAGIPARHDLRFGVVDGAAEHPIAAILDRDNIAILGTSKCLEYLGPIDPVMPV
jgi:hypothetical protein